MNTIDTTIIGCGPASLGLFVAADRNGEFDEFVRPGIALLERGSKPGSGGLRNIRCKSNSFGEDFVTSLRKGGIFADLINTPTYQQVAEYGNKAVPIPLVARLLEATWDQVVRVLGDYDKSLILPECEVTNIDLIPECGMRDHFDLPSFDIYGKVGQTSQETQLRSDHVVLATGAHEKGIDMSPHQHKHFLSRGVLTGESLPRIRELLLEQEEPQVVINGASHSAFATAHELLSQSDIPFGPGSIHIFYRSPVRLFYNTVEEAIADGYSFDPVKDVCPQTGRVYRYSGIREDAKELFRAIANGTEKRVVLQQFSKSPRNYEETLDRAAVIISALGYEANVIPIRDITGKRNGPSVTKGKVEVDSQARVRASSGRFTYSVYALGLGHGIQPNDQIGGEPSAKNHPVDSINIFHGPVAEMIYRQILDSRKKIRSFL